MRFVHDTILRRYRAKSNRRSAGKFFTGAKKMKMIFSETLLFAITAERPWRILPNVVGTCGPSVPTVRRRSTEIGLLLFGQVLSTLKVLRRGISSGSRPIGKPISVLDTLGRSLQNGLGRFRNWYLFCPPGGAKFGFLSAAPRLNYGLDRNFEIAKI